MALEKDLCVDNRRDMAQPRILFVFTGYNRQGHTKMVAFALDMIRNYLVCLLFMSELHKCLWLFYDRINGGLLGYC